MLLLELNEPICCRCLWLPVLLYHQDGTRRVIDEPVCSAADQRVIERGVAHKTDNEEFEPAAAQKLGNDRYRMTGEEVDFERQAFQ